MIKCITCVFGLKRYTDNEFIQSTLFVSSYYSQLYCVRRYLTIFSQKRHQSVVSEKWLNLPKINCKISPNRYFDYLFSLDETQRTPTCSEDTHLYLSVWDKAYRSNKECKFHQLSCSVILSNSGRHWIFRQYLLNCIFIIIIHYPQHLYCS